MKDSLKKALKGCVDNNETLSGSDALALLECGAGDMPEIMWAANAVRQPQVRQPDHLVFDC